MTTNTTPSTQKPSTPAPAQPVYRPIELSLINRDPKNNARTVMDDDKTKELAATMKREGQLQAIRVEVGENGRYDLVFGYRRCEAAILLNWTHINAEVVAKMEPEKRLLANIAENMSRDDLTTYDQAMAFHQAQKTYSLSGTSIANSVGCSVSYVNNLIRIVEGAEPVILNRWKEECTPKFGKDPETGKRLPNIHPVCSTEWLGKLVARVPRADQETELQRVLGLIPDDDGDEDTNDGGSGDGGAQRDTDAPRRATMKQLEKALAYAEKAVKDAEKSGGTKEEVMVAVNQAKGAVSALKYAMGKTQGIRLIGYDPKTEEKKEADAKDAAKEADAKAKAKADAKTSGKK